jgi:hypothetical protein
MRTRQLIHHAASVVRQKFVEGFALQSEHQNSGRRARRCEKNQNSSRQDAKAQSVAKKKSLYFFADFAYLAALRETGLSVRGLVRRFRSEGTPWRPLGPGMPARLRIPKSTD